MRPVSQFPGGAGARLIRRRFLGFSTCSEFLPPGKLRYGTLTASYRENIITADGFTSWAE